MARLSRHSSTYAYAKQQRSLSIKGSKRTTKRKPYKLTELHKANIRASMNNSELARASREKLTQYVLDHLPIIHTPHGEFKGVKNAALSLGIHHRTLQYRLISPHFPDWFSRGRT